MLVYVEKMESNSDEDWKESPKKRKVENEQCIIHCRLDRGKLVSVASVEQWLTLYEAAKTLHHMPLLTIANDLEEGTIPDIRYHKNCRSTFILKSQRRANQSDEHYQEGQVS